MAHILVLNGPNLNLLGTREPHVYGSKSLAEIENRITALAQEAGHQLVAFQSNAEHELVNAVHRCVPDKVDFLLINPGAFTHTSIALRDAILAVAVPFIELHLSNVFARETFRHHSYLSDIAVGTITGLGSRGYDFALQAALDYLEHQGAAG